MSPRGGRKSVALGASLEAVLEYVHQRYWVNHRIWVRHNGIAGVWRRGKGRGKAVFVPIGREAAPDYYGCVYGHFVGFDAKSTENTNVWRLTSDRMHQLDYLQAIHEAEGLAWFAVEHRPTSRLLLAPVHSEDRKAFVVDLRHPAEDVLIVPGIQGYYDWLPAVVRAWIPEGPQNILA